MLVDSFACPYCKLPLQVKYFTDLSCNLCNRIYKVEKGLYHFYDKDYWKENVDSVNTFIKTVGKLATDTVYAPSVIYPYSKLSEDLNCHERAALLNISIELALENNCFQGTVIDLGSGCGTDTYILSHFAPIVAIDIDCISTCGIQLLNPEINLGITRIVASGEYLPFLDNSISMIYMMSVFHHIKNKIAALNEWYRILKPGGILIAAGERPAKDIEERDININIVLSKGQTHEALWFDTVELFGYFSQCHFTNIKHIPIKASPNMGYLLLEDLIVEDPYVSNQYLCNNGLIYGIK
jgi:SAM-dependent methyltransferase